MHAILKKPPYEIIDNEKLNGSRLIAVVETLRKSDSLRTHFREVMNQAVVLLVSYFASAIHDVFRLCVVSHIAANQPSKLLTDEFRTNLSELLAITDDFDNDAADFFLTKKQDISFQDMKSISRTFRDYFSIETDIDPSVVDNIIAGQACRHAIVHSGARASLKTINELRAAPNRSILQAIERDASIDVSADDLSVIEENMKMYISRLSDAVETRLEEMQSSA